MPRYKPSPAEQAFLRDSDVIRRRMELALKVEGTPELMAQCAHDLSVQFAALEMEIRLNHPRFRVENGRQAP